VHVSVRASGVISSAKVLICTVLVSITQGGANQICAAVETATLAGAELSRERRHSEAVAAPLGRLQSILNQGSLFVTQARRPSANFLEVGIWPRSQVSPRSPATI